MLKTYMLDMLGHVNHLIITNGKYYLQPFIKFLLKKKPLKKRLKIVPEEALKFMVKIKKLDWHPLEFMVEKTLLGIKWKVFRPFRKKVVPILGTDILVVLARLSLFKCTKALHVEI